MADEWNDADLYVAPIPHCPVHGRMHVRVAADPADGANVLVYACLGFDGEGCDHIVRCDDQDWQHIGTADGISFTAPLDSPNTRIALGEDP